MVLHIDSRHIARLAMLVAMATAVQWLEGLLPPLFPTLPGAKLGLANVFVLFALYQLRVSDALLISCMRCVLGLFLSGSVIGFFYSFAGALLSWAVMVLLKKWSRCSLYGVSIAGALAHNTGQVGMAVLLVKNTYVLSYLPYLALLSIPFGLLTGALCEGCTKLVTRSRR